jgi:hypothetical protein
MVGTVLFLGAGATKSCGGPLTNEILPQFLAASDPLSPPTLLTDFFAKLFHVGPGSPQEQFPAKPAHRKVVCRNTVFT